MRFGVTSKIFHSPKQGVRTNYTATTDPTPLNDASQGYDQGSEWYNTITTEMYRCADVSVIGEAVWMNTTLTIDDLATVALSGDYYDLGGRPVFADVAFSGSFLDLVDVPSTISVGFKEIAYGDGSGGLISSSGIAIDTIGLLNFNLVNSNPVAYYAHTTSIGLGSKSSYSANTNSTADTVMSTYGATNTSVGWGVTLGGYSELLSSGASSNGMIIGTSGSKNLYLGTNSTFSAIVDGSTQDWNFQGNDLTEVANLTRTGLLTLDATTGIDLAFNGTTELSVESGLVEVQNDLGVLGETIFGAGSIGAGRNRAFTTASQGLVLVGKTGSTNDFAIRNGSGTEVLTVPTGTTTVYVAALGTGTVYSNSGKLTNTNPSDERLKTIHGALTYGLAEIKQLETFRYSYNWELDREVFGYSAQQVKEIMPELVTTYNHTMEDGEVVERYGFDKDMPNPMLVNAIKELHSIIESQAAEIEILKSSIN